MPTGSAIRQRVIRNTRGALGFLGKTTALAANTTVLRDALRFDMNTLSPDDESGAFVRITGTSNSDRGFTGRVTHVDTTTGDINFDPACGAAIVSGTTYELWYHGIRPDHVDEARDLALTTRNSPWRVKPLSVLPEVAEWSTAAYSSSSGGETNSAATVVTLDYPSEWFQSSLLVTNSGADGYDASRSVYVQPTHRYTLFGRVSVRAQTASIRVRDITNGADITLTGDSTFTLRGWQWFKVELTVPTGCGELQVWLGGTSASCIGEWAGVGLLRLGTREVSIDSRVLSAHDVAHFYAFEVPSEATGDVLRYPIGANRQTAGDGVLAILDEAITGPVYYGERHRYTALQSDYMSLTDRTTGDDAETDCNVDYAAWATIVELLEPMKRTAELDRVLVVATKNLRAWDRRVGADPLVIPQYTTPGGIGVLSL